DRNARARSLGQWRLRFLEFHFELRHQGQRPQGGQSGSKADGGTDPKSRFTQARPLTPAVQRPISTRELTGERLPEQSCPEGFSRVMISVHATPPPCARCPSRVRPFRWLVLRRRRGRRRCTIYL